MKREQNIFDISGDNLKYDKRRGQKMCGISIEMFLINNFMMIKFLSTPLI